MKAEDIVMGTGIPAFARGPAGTITAWNESAEATLAMPARTVVGKPCHRVLDGRDELGNYCCESCPTWRTATGGHPILPYQIQIRDGQGRRLGVTVNIVVVPEDAGLSLIHLLEPSDRPDVDVAQ